MTKSQLTQAVEKFTAVTEGFSEVDLSQQWAWRDYTGEGTRFAFFRVNEELRQLAANLATERAANGPAMTTAQRILAQYQAAYHDLKAVLIGVGDAEFEQPPGKDEWPVREVLAHIIIADMRFYTVVRHNLDCEREGAARPETVEAYDWEALTGPMETFKKTVEEGSLDDVLDYYETHHQRVLKGLTDISEEELESPTKYWDADLMPAQFRLLRFESHLRQHTIQIEKTLTAVSGPPSEAKRLLRVVYAALAEVEGVTLGVPQLGAAARQAVAQQIEKWADEVADATAG